MRVKLASVRHAPVRWGHHSNSFWRPCEIPQLDALRVSVRRREQQLTTWVYIESLAANKRATKVPCDVPALDVPLQDRPTPH
jgi:hypothetical protein